MLPPSNPIAAVVHLDPYPYYAALLTSRPIYRDAELGLWVAASAQAVNDVLSSPLCRVRPPAEPVPASLLGSPAGDIFRHLVRMNDGLNHCPFKQAVSATLGTVAPAHARERSARWARVLCEELAPHRRAGRIAEFAFHLPVYVVADLLGVAHDKLRQTVRWVNDFVRAIAPAANAEQIANGKLAAGHLLNMTGCLAAQQPEGLLSTLARQAQRFGRSDGTAIAANGIGFLSQAYEATAGLIGNTLRALAAHPDLGAQVCDAPALLGAVIEEVLRADPPIQNTRRFVAEDGLVAGQPMQAGDAILVLLAAANHDPAANPQPERFMLHRPQRQCFTFGLATHACPGTALAAAIAQAGVAQLLAAGLDLGQLRGDLSYCPSVNARIPLFERNTFS